MRRTASSTRSRSTRRTALFIEESLFHQGEHPLAMVLLGVDSTAKLLVAQAVSAQLDRALFRIGLDALPSQVSEIENLSRVWQREATLLPIALYIDAQADGASPSSLAALNRFVTRAIRSERILFIGTREPLARAAFHSQAFDVARPSAEEQFAEWGTALESLSEERRKAAAGRLSGQFSLNCSDIRWAVAETPAKPLEALPERLWDHCRDRSRPRLDTLAQRIDVRATWDDLVVTAETERLLREIVGQVACRGTVYGEWQFARRMNRGLGITALFAGDSGTGKTMAAEVIASELRLALYRIDRHPADLKGCLARGFVRADCDDGATGLESRHLNSAVQLVVFIPAEMLVSARTTLIEKSSDGDGDEEQWQPVIASVKQTARSEIGRFRMRSGSGFMVGCGSVLRPRQLPEIVEERALAAVGRGPPIQVELVGGGRLSQERDASDARRRNGSGVQGHFGPLIVPHRVEPQIAGEAVEALASEDDQAPPKGVEEGHGVVARGGQGTCGVELGPRERLQAQGPQVVLIVRRTEQLPSWRRGPLISPEPVAAEHQQRVAAGIVSTGDPGPGGWLFSGSGDEPPARVLVIDGDIIAKAGGRRGEA